MPEKETSIWAAIAAGLAAFGGMIRYCWANKRRSWRDAFIDIVASVFLGIVAFLITSPYLGETTAAGIGGACGHVGTRQLIIFIKTWIDR